MKKSLKRGLMAALALTVVACASTAIPFSTLRDTSVASADSAPDAKTYQGKQPGKHALITRTFSGQPPLIPHTIENFDISSTVNDCWECHNSNEFKGKKMPMVSISHLVKPASAHAEPELNKSRWQCNSCHVPQIDAQPLVANDFKAN